MVKKILLVMLLSLCCVQLSCAEEGEEITLTTYYPAPYGEYDSLSIGSGYVAPGENGNLIVEGNVGIGTMQPEATLAIEKVVTGYGDPFFSNLLFSVRGKRESRSDPDLGLVWLQYGPQAAPLFVLSDYDNPSRIQFQQTGTGTEASPELASWIGLARSRSSSIAIMGGNVGIGTTTPDSRAVLDLGVYASPAVPMVFLPPRMDATQKAAISNPPKGSVIYNTTTDSLEVNQGTAASPNWQSAAGGTGTPANAVNGAVTVDGNVNYGSGFSSSRISTGRYQVSFDEAFTNTPSVVAISNTSTCPYWLSVYDVSVTGFKVRASAWNGAMYNRAFQFIAMET